VLFLAVSVALAGPSLAGAQGIEEPRIPLRTALKEIRTLREAYAESFNRKDAAAVADMYAPDATAILRDGRVLNGKDAIRQAFVAEAAKWPHMTITSDTVRVFGHTAWDVGTTRAHRAEGGEEVSHYLVVLRRGLKDWKISGLAAVPESDSAKTAH
jgi:uncharacterized protein (TIGR02246 family)